MRLFCSWLLVIAAVSPLWAQEKQNARTPQSIAQAFFETLQRGGTDAALDGLLKDSPLLEQPAAG